MAAKNNIRSIRFSDEMAELIDRQQGRSFTEKFENLITKCVRELPAKKRELAQLEARIREKRKQLQNLTTQAGELTMTIHDLRPKIIALESSLDRAVEK